MKRLFVLLWAFSGPPVHWDRLCILTRGCPRQSREGAPRAGLAVSVASLLFSVLSASVRVCAFTGLVRGAASKTGAPWISARAVNAGSLRRKVAEASRPMGGFAHAMLRAAGLASLLSVCSASSSDAVLWGGATDIATCVLASPFIRSMCDGTLDARHFAQYMIQDTNSCQISQKLVLTSSADLGS